MTTTGHELRVEEGACRRCGGDVAYLPPCTCGHGSIGKCRGCSIIVLAGGPRLLEVEQHRDGTPPAVFVVIPDASDLERILDHFEADPTTPVFHAPGVGPRSGTVDP